MNSKYRQRSYDNLKTGKLSLQQSVDKGRPKSPRLKVHDEANGRCRKLKPANELSHMFNPIEERDDDRKRRRSRMKADRMSLTSMSSSSSVSSLSSSPPYLTPSHINLKLTLIPIQYRVYIPQKRYEMKQAYTGTVYDMNEPCEVAASQSNAHDRHVNAHKSKYPDST